MGRGKVGAGARQGFLLWRHLFKLLVALEDGRALVRASEAHGTERVLFLLGDGDGDDGKHRDAAEDAQGS